MADPATQEEYEERFRANHVTRGTGPDATQVFPCPFCASPGWLVASNADMSHSTDDIYCIECGRSARLIVTPAEPARMVKDRFTGEQVMTAASLAKIEVVQTFGRDAPPWGPPRMESAE